MDLKQGIGRTALAIAQKLKGDGHTVYFAGGCVRDHLMAKSPQDIDIATSAKPEQVERFFKKTIPIGKQYGVMWA